MPPRYDASPAVFRDYPLRFLVCLILIPVFGAGLVLLGVWWIIARSTRLTVDEVRATLTSGILSKQVTEVQLSSIRTVKIDKTLVDRIFDVGTVSVFTSGDAPELVVKGMPDPEALAKALRREV
jgi:uncharacterized membrane protein YdbT with pleckstrin-like domain